MRLRCYNKYITNREEMKMSLAEKKKVALSAYKETKAKYLETMSNEDWIKFCEVKRVCMLLGVII